MAIRTLGQEEQVERVNGGRLLRAGTFTLVAAAAATAMTGLIEGAIGVLPQDIPSFQPAGIAGGTIVQVGLGILVLALLSKYARRPISTFRTVALVWLVLSMLSPIAAGMGLIPGFPIDLPAVLGLILLHVVAGAIAIGVLTTQVQEL